METFSRLLHATAPAVRTTLGAIVASDSDEPNNYYDFNDSSYSRYLQEEESNTNATTTAGPTMLETTIDEMAGAGGTATTNATTVPPVVPTFAPTADPNGTDSLLEDVLEVPDPFNATAGLTDTEVIRTTCRIYGSIFLILFIVFLVVRKAFPGTYASYQYIALWQC